MQCAARRCLALEDFQCSLIALSERLKFSSGVYRSNLFVKCFGTQKNMEDCKVDLSKKQQLAFPVVVMLMHITRLHACVVSEQLTAVVPTA